MVLVMAPLVGILMLMQVPIWFSLGICVVVATVITVAQKRG